MKDLTFMLKGEAFLFEKNRKRTGRRCNFYFVIMHMMVVPGVINIVLINT